MPFGISGGVSANVGVSVGASVNVNASANLNVNASIGGSIGANANVSATLGSPGQRANDPYMAHNFKVELFGGIIAGGFSEVSGLSIQVDVERKTFGGQHNTEYKFVKGIKYPDLVLKRGMGAVDLLWGWYMLVLNGTIFRQNGSIILYDQAQNRVRQWDFEGAFPIKWDGPTFNATSNTVAIESLTLVHQGLKMVF